MRIKPTGLLGTGLLALYVGVLQAQTQPDFGHATELASVTAKPQHDMALRVSSPAFADGADIPRDNTLYGANRFPGLTWTAGPRGTRSYLVIVQGTSPSGPGQTSIHFTLFNIPTAQIGLSGDLALPPRGARFGPNVHGLDQPWSGPHPHTAARQAYHFQVLALDRHLPDRAGQTYAAIIAAAQGHVLAVGDLTGYAARPPAASAPAPAPSEARVSAELISRADALTLVRASVEACEKRSEHAAAFVTDAEGNLRAALSADGMNPIGLRSAGRKTATVLQFKQSTHALRDRLATDAAFAAEFGKDERFYYSPGGLPLFRGSRFVAVLSVGGGHTRDEECALEALALVPWARTSPE